ncbi:hypothetical protein, conserved in T.vivax [Trypanosoma vivax Y486]|uniref:Trypanosome variant surface glycoprotein B-type N-terminal domain-containing protein n=1 Tax=Trypanosoma vivax (strain Y486) TaxID=1055687 RepID=F9WRU0_TRYVY|nr:hypothetical protein, conserved in T.vivax [Trypanosoma vivax Y486]|eukprot:CCD20274.1 hypothetical protein, conserved in T.vivax [Trypanosoma vivax Y486]
MLRHVLVALACACLLARSCTCAKEAKGLAFDTASALCNTATVLAGISAAAESAAAEMKRRRGFLSSWRRVASEVSEETQNLTVAGEAEKLERVAEVMGDIEHEALAVAGAAARQSVRLTDFVKLFATFSGSVNGGGKTCIGKATGSNQDAATANGTADYIYANLGCDVSPEEIATMKAHIIQHGTAPAKVGTRSIKGATLTDQVQQPAHIALETGVDTAADGKGCPLVVHRAHKSAAIAGVIEAQENGGNARKVDWAGLIEMTPSSTSTNSGTNADAATTMRWKNDALDELGTMATRYAKMRQQAIDATKACEATNRCKEAHAQDRNDMVQESRQRARETQEHTEKRDGTEKGEDDAQTCTNTGGVFDAQHGRCVVSAGTHSGKNKAGPNAERESASAERMGTAWPRVAATMALAMTTKEAD